MKFRLGSEVLDRPCFREDVGELELIDQRLLPHEVSMIRTSTVVEQVEMIRTLAVRGAPAIGSFGAYSLALAISRDESAEDAYSRLLGSRPTAVDLRNCMDEVKEGVRLHGAGEAIDTASRIYSRTIETCRRIGEKGASVIPDAARILTHCNAGALASIDWGTALAPIRFKARSGGDPFVWVSETRPLLQGARLTAWELGEEGVRHSVVVDSACGHLMRSGKVDLVITGADRVCANGDLANKVGTYGKAVLAKENGIPFYVAFPDSTIDRTCPSGGSIPIEERDALEVAVINGNRIIPEWTHTFNPAFDVTPAKYVTGYITGEGIFTLPEFKDKYVTGPDNSGP